MNLVLIGRFKQIRDAEKVEKDITKLTAQALEDDSHSLLFAGPEDQRFSEKMLSLMSNLKLLTLEPSDLGQLLSEHNIERKDDQITVKTDEAEVSAFVKLFVEAGAKVEIFSAHDYPSDSDDEN